MGKSLDKAVKLLNYLNNKENLNDSLSCIQQNLLYNKDEVLSLVEKINSLRDLIVVKDDVISLKEKLDLLDASILYKTTKGKGRTAVIGSLLSTNTEMLSNTDNLVSGDAIVCEIQTKGRGRQDHKWHSSIATSLTLSICSIYKKIKDVEGLSIVVGIAIVKVLEEMEIKCSLKWPNDLFIEDKKLGGILIESTLVNKSLYAIIGIGLNVYKNTYEDNSFNYTSLEEYVAENNLDITLNRSTLCVAIINKVKEYVLNFKKTGVEPFLDEFNKYDYLANKKIEVKNGNELIKGVACGLSSKGYLQIKDKDNNIYKIEIISGHIQLIK